MFEWEKDTEPFTDANGGLPARFVVEQVTDTEFRLQQAFAYKRLGGQPVAVTPEALGESDLASIPAVMSWFVPRYGRHTPAALMHDQLVVDGMDTRERVEADRLFLDAMDDLAVPPVRSRLMWAAVTAATRWNAGWAPRLALLVWGLASAVGTGFLVRGVLTGNPVMVAAALLGPVAGSVLWGSQFRAGLIGGYAIPAVLLPAAASWLGYATYWTVETAVRLIRKTLPTNRHEELPKPVSYRET